jgi:hypothetical protein
MFKFSLALNFDLIKIKTSNLGENVCIDKLLWQKLQKKFKIMKISSNYPEVENF